jgi:hypothetical protein
MMGTRQQEQRQRKDHDDVGPIGAASHGEAPAMDTERYRPQSIREIAAMAPVQRKADGGALAGGDVQSVASAGVAGAGHALPHLGTIQNSFGRHDVGGVQAHTDGAAAASSSALGAKAYATGDHVAFRGAPDLHTAAHEAAHVVQQRAGVARKAIDERSESGGRGPAGSAGGEGARPLSIDGGASDSFEQHADRVADAVVGGQSAEPLLDQVAGQGQSAPAATIQRKPESEQEEDAPAHQTYEPTWDEVVAAAQDDEAALAILDVAWIDGLSGDLREQIDGSFTVGKEHAAVAVIKKKQAAAIEKKFATDKKALEKETKERLGPKAKKSEIQADAEYQEAMAELGTKHDQDVAKVEADAQAEVAGQRRKFKAGSTKVKPPTEVSWMEGRLLSRVNFMAWGIALLGSASAVKTHFSGIGEVPNAGGLRLASEPKARFVKARSWFEDKFPGNTFRSTSVGQSLRGRHQGDHSRGEQGHPLGISVDFDAYDNPHQKDAVAKFMLKQFGGTTKTVAGKTERTEGDNRMELPADSWDQVRQMGKDMDAGHEPTEKQLAFLKQSDDAYDEMFATSQRFQESMKDQMPALRTAQSIYISQVRPGRQRLVEIDGELAKARAAAAKKAKDDAAAVDADPKVVALTAEQTQLKAAIEPLQVQVNETLKAAFAPWVKEMQGYIEQQQAAHSEADMALKVDSKVAHEVGPKIQKAKKPAQLKEILNNKKYKPLFADFDAALIDSEFEVAKEKMAKRAEDVASARDAAGEVWFREELIKRLSDPESVFGAGERKENDGKVTYSASKAVADPTVMQYLERGFVRHDELNVPGDGIDDNTVKKVFNGEFIQAMLLHGFFTGAAWNSAVDTMHFDFLDGYDKIVGSPGGDKKFGPTD